MSSIPLAAKKSATCRVLMSGAAAYISTFRSAISIGGHLSLKRSKAAEILQCIREKIDECHGVPSATKQSMIRQAIGSMPLEGIDILIGFAFSLLRFDSPCDCNASLVLGISNCCRDSASSVEASVDAMALLVWVEIRCCQPLRDKVVLFNVGFNSRVNNGVDAAVSIRSRACCLDILERHMLVKGSREFVLGTLL